MEEEIQMLFRLAMPEDWRNRMPTTPLSSPSSSESCCVTATNLNPSTNFWTKVGLRSYAQMDFDLELSLDHNPRHHQGSHRPTTRRGSKTGPIALGGLMYHPDNSSSNTMPKSLARAMSQKEEAEIKDLWCGGSGGGMGEECNEIIVPPNALCLINILRLTLDSPFREIRKQAANVLLLLKVTYECVI